MSIFDRMERIAKAHVSWLIEKAEPRTKDLQARISELQLAIGEGRECAATYAAMCRRMEREMKYLTKRREDCQAQAEAAVKADDEASAREALNEKIMLNEQMSHLSPGIAQGRVTYDHLRSDIACLEEQLDQAREKLRELKRRKHHKHATDETPTPQQIQDSSSVEDRQQAVESADLRQSSRDLQIEAELDAIKRRLRAEDS